MGIIQKSTFGAALLAIILLSVFTEVSFNDLRSTFLGICGAIVANSTGAGGGVVFMPVFKQWALNSQESLATSLAIQCFGMTTGSLAWLYYFKSNKNDSKSTEWSLFTKLLPLTIIPSIMGVLLAQYSSPLTLPPIEYIFAVLSIVFGLLTLSFTIHKSNNTPPNIFTLSTFDPLLIILISLIGGIITAWISVGVGELVILYLFARNFPLNVAIATAVCCSSATVLAAINYHALFSNNIISSILIFAAPGAIIGGSIAQYFASRIGQTALKLLLGAWILFSGIVVFAQQYNA